MNMFKIEDRNLEMKASDLRAGGIIPGSIYGKHIEGAAIRATKLELNRVTEKSGEIYKVSFGGKNYFTKIHEVQKNPVTGEFIHFSLVELPKGETNTLDIPLTIKGEAIGEKSGGTVLSLSSTVSISGLIKDMPEELVADVSKMEIGDKITFNDLNLPKNLTTDMDMEEAIVVCLPPTVVEEVVEVEEGLNTPSIDKEIA